MDQQVSPAVVVIVLILIVAILVGLYFLVVERKPQPANGETDMDMAPMEDIEEPLDEVDGEDQPGADEVDDSGEAVGGDETADSADEGTDGTEDTISDDAGSEAGEDNAAQQQ